MANRGFQDTHTVSPSRLRDDLEAQRRYRDKATPILAQRVTVEPRDARPDAVDHPGVRRISHGPERVRLGGSIGSFYSVDETSGTGLKHGVEYLELNDIPQDVSVLGTLFVYIIARISTQFSGIRVRKKPEQQHQFSCEHPLRRRPVLRLKVQGIYERSITCQFGALCPF